MGGVKARHSRADQDPDSDTPELLSQLSPKPLDIDMPTYSGIYPEMLMIREYCK